MSTIILTMVSLSDLQTGRIPFLLLGLALALLLLFLDPISFINHVLVGFFSLVLGFVFHKLGFAYAHYRKLPQTTAVFGLGDSYVLGIFGLLFPFPEGWIAFSLGLLFAILINGVVKKKPYEPLFSQKIRLGFYFLLGGVVMNFWLMFIM